MTFLVKVLWGKEEKGVRSRMEMVREGSSAERQDQKLHRDKAEAAQRDGRTAPAAAVSINMIPPFPSIYFKRET